MLEYDRVSERCYDLVRVQCQHIGRVHGRWVRCERAVLKHPEHGFYCDRHLPAVQAALDLVTADA